MAIILLFFGTIAILLLMTGHLVESCCLKSHRRSLAVLLPMVPAFGSVYGLLRATGILLYASDRYTRDSLLFDYSNQSAGCGLLFLCVPFVLGTAVALAQDMRRESS